MPKVSVIIPVYNVEKYLRECLDSVINQTLGDIEIICINDCSPDNSLDILKEYASKDARINIINFSENRGPGVARNAALDIAQGEYIMFLDPDDWYELDACETAYNQISQNQNDIVMFNYQEYYESSGKCYEKWAKITPFLPYSDNPHINLENLDINWIVNAYSWTQIYSRAYLNFYNIRYSDYRLGEDVPFVIKSYILSNNISVCLKVLYNYRIRDNKCNQSSNAKLWKNLIDARFEILEYIKTLNKTKNLLPYIIYLAKVTYWFEKFYTLLSLNKRKDFYKNFQQLFKNIENTYHILDLPEAKFNKKLFQKIITQNYYQYELFKLLKNIFSIKNRSARGKKHKEITILGIKLKILSSKNRKEIKLINEIKKIKSISKNAYILFDNLNDSKIECIDAYTLFKQLLEQGKDVYYIILEDNPLYNKIKNSNFFTNIISIKKSVKKYPSEFLNKIKTILPRTKYIITSYGELSPTTQRFFYESENFEYIFIQHGVTYLKESVLLSRYIHPNKYNKILVTSNIEKDLFKKYGFADTSLILSGFPRWDKLSTTANNNQKSILFMFTYRKYEKGNIEDSIYLKNIKQLLNNKELKIYAEQNNIKIYYSVHHCIKFMHDVEINVKNSNIEQVSQFDLSRYIKNCSCFVTDYSSVAFDFMFQNKPVIFYIPDINDNNLILQDKFNVKRFLENKSRLHNVCENETQLIEKIKYYNNLDFNLETDIKNEYSKFFYIKNGISEHLINKIENAGEGK